VASSYILNEVIMESRTVQFQRKEYLRALHEEKIERFKKSEDPNMTLLQISWVPGQDFSDELVTYTKTIRKVGAGRIFIIKKDGRPISFTWETKPENIKVAVTAGIVNPKALTSKVVCTIGDYRARVLERAYEDGIVSNKYQEKKALLDFWQQRVVMLQPLERLINTNKNPTEVAKAFDDYILAVREYKRTLAVKMAVLVKYDANIQEKLGQFLEDDIAAIESLRASIVAGAPLKSLLAAYGRTSLMTKLNVMMIKMAKQAQGLNQNLTHARPDRTDSFFTSLWQGAFSLFRGYFNDICEDVMRVINNHDPDLHNPVLPAHQGDFAAQEELGQNEEKQTDELDKEKKLEKSQKPKEEEGQEHKQEQKLPSEQTKQCGFISIQSPLDEKNIEEALKKVLAKFSTTLNAAYVYSPKGLFYINKSRNEYIKIRISTEKLSNFEKEIVSFSETENLTKERLKKFTSMTGHSHDRLYLEFSPENRKALAAICQIEQADEIELSETGDYSLKKNQRSMRGSIPLQKTGYTSWWLSDASTNHTGMLTRAFYFVWNVGTGFFLTVPDIVWGLIVGGFNLENGSLVEAVKKTPKKDLPKTAYSKIAKNMKVPNKHIAFGIAHILGKAFSAFMLDLAQGVILAVEQIRVELPAFIRDDYYVGGWGDAKKSVVSIGQQFDRDIGAIQHKQQEQDAYYQDQHEGLDDDCQPDLMDRETPTKKKPPRRRNHNAHEGARSSLPDKKEPADDRHFALPPYDLSPGEWEDLVSAIPRGLKAFAGNILHPIHAKNPFVGLIYNFFYFAGGFAVLMPHAVPLPQSYKDFSQWLGAQMAHDPVGQAVSSAVTQAQGAAMLVEAPMHGPKSMLGQVCHTVEESMIDISVLLLLAWSGGFALKAMPVLGDFIRSEMGNAGYITLATYGGKMGMLIHELCEAGETQPVSEEHTQQLKERWIALAKELHSKVQESKTYQQSDLIVREAIDETFFEISNPATLENMANQAKFLKKLTTHAHLLPHLPSRTKREIMQAAEQLFSGRPEVVTAVKNMLDPYKPYSIASRTLRVLTGYIICLLRIVPCCLFTGNFKQPVKDLAKKVAKDLVRVVRGLHGLGAFVLLGLYAAIYTPLRAVADGFLNGVFARIEGGTRGNQHSISQVTSQAASWLSGTYYRLGDVFTPASLYKSVTHPDPRVVMRDPSSEYFGSLFKEKEHSEPSSTTSLSSGPLTRTSSRTSLTATSSES